MTIKEAWYEIFLAFATPREERNESQRMLTGLGHIRKGKGICNAFWVLYGNCKITMWNRENMRDLIRLQIWNQYFYPRSPRNDILRACYCYFEYLDAEELK